MMLQINYIRLPQYCTQKKFSTCKCTAFFIHFHGQITPKWPKSLSPSPWQPYTDTKILTLVFEFLHQRAHLVQISSKSETCRFQITLVLRESGSLKLFYPHAFRSLLCIRFVTVAFQSEEAVLWRRDPSLIYFCPTLDPPLGGVCRKV